MKRFLLLFSALMLSCIALWAHDVVIDDIYYNLDVTNKTAEVTYGGDYYYYDDYYDDYGYFDYYDDYGYFGSVTIPETITYNSEIFSVTSIGSSAFYNCSGLTSITIGESVTSIGDEAFEYCSGLTSVIWNAKNYKDFEDYDETPFYNIRSSITSFTFGNEVEHIPAYLCYDMENLKEVTIGNSVTSIGRYAFSGCSGLTSITIPNSVTSIGGYAFSGCSRLTSVTIPNSVTSIGDGAFYDCSGLTSITIGESVTSIGGNAFSGCSGLTEVTIPNSVTSIGYMAFSGCSGLTEVTIPNSVTFISSGAFYYTGIYNNNSNWDNGVLYIDNCLIEAKSDVVKGSYTIKKGTRIIGSSAFYDCSGLTEVTIPNSVTSIGSSAFYNCSGLTSITIGESVTSIDSYTFADCSGLTEVTIPNSVTSISYAAFYGCSGLTEVTIGESVTSIDEEAFSGCDKLRKVTAYPTTVPNAYESSFAHYNAYLYIPCDVYEDYDLDDVFGNFKYIKCIAGEEDVPTSITETLADANITISNGHITCPDTEFAIYNTIGQDVTAFNGSLQPGVYLVSIENDIVKVMIH